MPKQYRFPKPKRRRPRPSYSDDTQWRLQRPARRLSRLRKQSEIGAGVNRSLNRGAIRRRLRHVRIEQLQEAVGYKPEERKVKVSKPKHPRVRRTDDVSRPAKVAVVKEKKGRQWTDAQRQAQSARRKAIWQAKKKQKEFEALNDQVTQEEIKHAEHDVLKELCKRTHGKRQIIDGRLVNTETSEAIDINDPNVFEFFKENTQDYDEDYTGRTAWDGMDWTNIVRAIYEYIVERYANIFTNLGLGKHAWSQQLRDALWQISATSDSPEEFIERALKFAKDLSDKYERYGEAMDEFFVI